MKDTIRMTFLGAAKTVSGSCILIEAKTKNGWINFLVDCGLFQGHFYKKNFWNHIPYPFNSNEISFVLLTHAHIDHCGKAPKLYKEGFRGPIYATEATTDLCSIVLQDSGRIQRLEAEKMNIIRTKKKMPSIPVLYDEVDANSCLSLFSPVKYGEVFRPHESIEVRFTDAGHILGSAIIEIWINDVHNNKYKLVFTGDLGGKKLIHRDPDIVQEADCLIMESTYGGTIHGDKNFNLIEKISEAIYSGGNAILVAFAIDRIENLLWELKESRHLLPDKTEIYVDTLLGAKGLKIYNNKKYHHDFSAPIQNQASAPFYIPGLRIVSSKEESIVLNSKKGAIILTASGMGDFGPSVFHLEQNLPNPNSKIFFTGFLSKGSRGYHISSGVKEIKFNGKIVPIKAEILTTSMFSAHADHNELLEWLQSFDCMPKNIILNHGNYDESKALCNAIQKLPGFDKSSHVTIPNLWETLNIDRNQIINSELCLKRFNSVDILLESIDEISFNIEILTQWVEFLENNGINKQYLYLIKEGLIKDLEAQKRSIINYKKKLMKGRINKTRHYKIC